MLTNIESPLGNIRTYEIDGLKWFVSRDIIMSAIGYKNMTDLLSKVDNTEQGFIQTPEGHKLRVLTPRGLQQFFERTNSTKPQFSIMREWMLREGRGEDAVQVYFNGCVLYSMAVSMILMRPLAL